MSQARQSVNWKRRAIEGLVIVVSILLAFAIDAWWSERQDRHAEIRQLARVSAELNTNAESIERKLETLRVAVAATSEFLSWMGPEPTIVGPKIFLNAWTELYSIGTLTLLTGASEDYLAEGRLDTARNADVRNAIVDWYSQGDDLERQYNLLREAHANVGEYLTASMPMLHLHSANELMANHPRSKFPLDQAAVLSDPRTESLLAFYLIRLEFVTSQAEMLLKQKENVLALTESTEG